MSFPSVWRGLTEYRWKYSVYVRQNQQIMDFETEIGDIKCRCMADIDQKYRKYIEDIQVFGVNMSFISLSEVKKIYIS